MAHWAIAIGINQYQSQKLQPLLYAQRDAQSLRDFLVQEAHFEPSHCLTLTEFSESEQYPTQENLLRSIEQVCQTQIASDDVLWCFFSGYGIQQNGRDYLMPSDGDPDRPAETGIAIDAVMQVLKSAPTQQIVLLLDVNRSQNTVTGEGIGSQSFQLARQYQIATILSSQPQQFSHETLALRQGLFTAALIEAIRYRGCFTLDQLVQYLENRLPELSEQHWRPRQDPLTYVPLTQKYHLLVPETAAVQLEVSAPVGVTVGDGEIGSMGIRSLLERSYAASGIDEPAVALPPIDPDKQPTEYSSNGNPPVPTPASGAAVLLPKDPFWQRLFLWGSILVCVLVVGVLLRNAAVIFGRTKPALQAPASVTTPTAPANSLPTLAVPLDPATVIAAAQTSLQSRQFKDAAQQLSQLTPEQLTPETIALLEQANRGLLSQAKSMTSRTREPSSENQASDFVDAIEMARLVRPGQPLYDEAQQNIDRWSQIILDMAQGRADRSNDGSTPAAADNYGGAIRTALLVPNDRPEVYARAQQAIAQWSQLIFQLALDRAAEGNLDLAIQTAELVPPNTPTFPKAQESIAEWRKGQPPVNP
ncbi:caspase family protein [Leptolyngbya ohadii]|uniref:caspase family protein n=1 Tax=Leptolyngbya ohadii TaxID=1962290 RepID=UPI000B59F061|nr:caspase family protein [Leptolyngbya ohadii]